MRSLMPVAALLLLAGLLLLLLFWTSTTTKPLAPDPDAAAGPGPGRHEAPHATPALEHERVRLPGLGETNRLSGSVRAAESGEPIAGALVYAAPETGLARMSDTPHSTTDPSGRFSITFQVRPQRLVAQAPGFVSAAVPVDKDAVYITLVLDRGLGITGRVVDRTGAGLPGVTITALGPTAAGAYRLVDRFASSAEAQPNQAVGVSDATGGFAITGLRPGKVRLRASKIGWRRVPLPKGTFTDKEERLLRSTLPAAAGDANVRIVMEPVWALSIRVEDAETGRPIEPDRARVTQSIGPPRPDQRWNQTGVDDADWFSGNEPNFWAFRPYYVRQEVPGNDEMTFKIWSLGYEAKEVILKPRHPQDADYLEPEIVRLAPLAPSGRLELTVTIAGVPCLQPLLVHATRTGASGVPFRMAWAEFASQEAGDLGQRVIELPAGRYRMKVSGSPRAPTLDSEWFVVDIPELGVVSRSVDLETGLCEIRVFDTLGRGLANATVLIWPNDKAMKSMWLSASDSRALIERGTPLSPGLFRALLDPGLYSVRVACFGFQDRLIENITVGYGGTTSIDALLEFE